jgi:thioredoxin 1
MNFCKIIFVLIIIPLYFSLTLSGCNSSKEQPKIQNEIKKAEVEVKDESINDKLENKPTVTFIELGSVNCVPCRMMVPVIEKIEKEYGEKVKIVFYDVWTTQGQPYGQKYRIRVIPTQVFLDKDGNEFFRNEGFMPFNKIQQVLQKKGL